MPPSQRARQEDADDTDSDEEDERGRIDLPSMTGNLAYYSNPKEDPYMTLKEEDDIDSDEEDFTLEQTDLVLIGARSEEQVSHRQRPELCAHGPHAEGFTKLSPPRAPP